MEKINTGVTRAEYIEVETNVDLQITGGGEDRNFSNKQKKKYPNISISDCPII